MQDKEPILLQASNFTSLQQTEAEIERHCRALEQCADPQKAHIECQKIWLFVRNLNGRNEVEPALRLTGRLLELAEKFDLTLLCLNITLYQRIQYCMRGRNTGLCAEAERRYEYFRQMYDAEFQAEKSYTTLMALAIDNPDGPEPVLGPAKENYAALQPHLRAFQSPKLHLYGYLVELLRYTATHDFARAMHCCDKAIGFFRSRPYLARDPLQVFYYQRLICCIHLRQFEAGKQLALTTLDLVGNTLFNQLKIKELYFLLALHTRQYAEAAGIYTGVCDDPQSGNLPPDTRDTWELFGQYLHFLYTAGALEVPAGKQAGFRQPDFSTGETRLTTARAAVKFLLLLQQNRVDELLVLAETMLQYCQNSLTNGRTRRAYYFLNMLIQIPAGHFQRSLILPGSSGFLAKLKTAPLMLADQTAELEIVPYEDLWALALGSLNGVAASNRW